MDAIKTVRLGRPPSALRILVQHGVFPDYRLMPTAACGFCREEVVISNAENVLVAPQREVGPCQWWLRRNLLPASNGTSALPCGGWDHQSRQFAWIYRCPNGER